MNDVNLEAADETLSLLININFPCHIDADNAVSIDNFDEQSREAALPMAYDLQI